MLALITVVFLILVVYTLLFFVMIITLALTIVAMKVLDANTLSLIVMMMTLVPLIAAVLLMDVLTSILIVMIITHVLPTLAILILVVSIPTFPIPVKLETSVRTIIAIPQSVVLMMLLSVSKILAIEALVIL